MISKSSSKWLYDQPKSSGYFSNNLTREKHHYKTIARKHGLSGFWNSKEARKNKNSRLSNASYNEQLIASWLQSHTISFTFQATFKSCRDIKPLPFDFRINGKKVLIEYNGEQHSKPVFYDDDVRTVWDRFDLQIRHDKIKDNWANKNGFQLIRIYHDDDPIEVLNAHFNLLK